MLPLLALAAANATERIIYHSSQTPGYTAWVGLWSMPSGEVMTNFVEAKGQWPMNASFSFPVLATSNGAEWTAPSKPVVGYSRGVAVMPGGLTMVRPALTFGSDTIAFGPVGCDKQVNKDGSVGYCHTQYSHGDFNGVEISTDGGLTWGGVTYLASQQEVSKCIVTRIKALRDGRLVAVLGLKHRDGTSGDVLHHMAVGTFVDNATVVWEKPILTLPPKFGTCEESDIVELPNETLFFMHRAVSCPHPGPNCKAPPYENHIQSLVLRNRDGSFSPQPPTTTFLNYEFPCLVLTRKGNVLLHIQASGSRYSRDFGASWADLKHTAVAGGAIFTTHYYPRAVETADGTIVVTSHNSGDDAYMPRWPNGSLAIGSPFLVDQHIWAQTFRLVPA